MCVGTLRTGARTKLRVISLPPQNQVVLLGHRNLLKLTVVRQLLVLKAWKLSVQELMVPGSRQAISAQPSCYYQVKYIRCSESNASYLLP